MKLWRTALSGIAVAASLTSVTSAAPRATTIDTWADYSMMFGRNAGQARSADQTSMSQWAWSQISATESRIRWADPTVWATEPYPYLEHYQVDTAGGWVYLDGWEGNGTYYKLQMLAEFTGPDPTHLAPIPLDPQGRQHYVQWIVPGAPYSLSAVGVITEQVSGKRVLFSHQQTWYPPSTCSSPFVGTATCISQQETWADNNYGNLTGQLVQTVNRTNWIGKGRGMAFKVAPVSGTTLYGYANWTY